MNKALDRINQIKEYIDEHITEELSLTFLSEKFRINKHYLCHCFKKSSGCTLVRYINNKRIFLAKSYCASGMNLLDAAIEAGFGNYTSFYKAYRSEFGKAPSGKA